MLTSDLEAEPSDREQCIEDSWERGGNNEGLARLLLERLEPCEYA